MTEAIAIAWDAYLDSGRNITDPVFVRCVQAFAEKDRWAIIQGVPALMRRWLRVEGPAELVGEYVAFGAYLVEDPGYWATNNEWARFRLGCLKVQEDTREPAVGSWKKGEFFGAYTLTGDTYADERRLRRAEYHHWCGMIGRPKDDELLWIRRHLDEPNRNQPSAQGDRAWWFYSEKWGLRSYWDGTRAKMIATLDRWETVTDEERAKWARRDRMIGVGSTIAFTTSGTFTSNTFTGNTFTGYGQTDE